MICAWIIVVVVKPFRFPVVATADLPLPFNTIPYTYAQHYGLLVAKRWRGQ